MIEYAVESWDAEDIERGKEIWYFLLSFGSRAEAKAYMAERVKKFPKDRVRLVWRDCTWKEVSAGG